MRFAYCTGIRRCACSTNTMAAMMTAPDDDHHQEREETLGLPDAVELSREARGDLGEDQDRHSVADAAVGDQLAEPHDDRGAGRHREDDGQDHRPAVVGNDRRVTAGEDLTRGAGKRDEGGRLEDRQADRQVTRVLRELRLTGLALLLQPLEPRNHHDEQLDDDARRDVGHDAQRQDRQLEQRATAEQVDQRVDVGAVAAGDLDETGVNVLLRHPRRRDRAAQAEEQHDEEHEQHLLAQVGRAERLPEGPE